jgi:hypothetical protein
VGIGATGFSGSPLLSSISYRGKQMANRYPGSENNEVAPINRSIAPDLGIDTRPARVRQAPEQGMTGNLKDLPVGYKKGGKVRKVGVIKIHKGERKTTSDKVNRLKKAIQAVLSGKQPEFTPSISE